MKKFATEPFVLRMTAKEIKDGLVAAHRAGDWEAAKRFSQFKQAAKRRNRPHCSSCGVAVNKSSARCGRCYRQHRYRSHALPV